MYVVLVYYMYVIWVYYLYRYTTCMWHRYTTCMWYRFTTCIGILHVRGIGILHVGGIGMLQPIPHVLGMGVPHVVWVYNLYGNTSYMGNGYSTRMGMTYCTHLHSSDGGTDTDQDVTVVHQKVHQRVVTALQSSQVFGPNSALQVSLCPQFSCLENTEVKDLRPFSFPLITVMVITIGVVTDNHYENHDRYLHYSYSNLLLLIETNKLAYTTLNE